jgi:heat-inducible transcriptional repressor
MALDRRKATILKEVVYRYITTGNPVGSTTICESLNLGISPATIRNELSKLEEMGYLCHPHTSAGRVPTTMGYRYYVDSLYGRARLRKEEKEAVVALFSAKTNEMERTLQEATDLLSRLTRSLAMVITPPLRRSTLKHLDLVSMSDRLMLLVIITNTGRVEKKLVEMEGEVEEGLLQRVQNFLNRRLCDKTFDELEEPAPEHSRLPVQVHALVRKVYEEIREMLTREESEGVFVMGKANLVRAHQKEDVERIEQLMEALEQQCFILNLVKEVVNEKQLLVRIGNENLLEELRGFSLVATPYTVDEDQQGTIGVLGPMRMDYARIIPTVDFIARSLSKSLQILRG